MNKIIYFMFLLFSALSVHAQTTLACQETQSTGFSWKSTRWQSTGFNASTRFFLRINIDGKIEPSSLSKLNMYQGDTQCKVLNSAAGIMGKRVHCTDFDGTSINLNLETYEGAIAMTSGANQKANNGYKDTVSVSLFVCQPM
jgi:hypothetical protein